VSRRCLPVFPTHGCLRDCPPSPRLLSNFLQITSLGLIFSFQSQARSTRLSESNGMRLPFFFFFMPHVFLFFSRVTQFSNGAGSIRELLLLDDQQFLSSSSLSLSVGGESSVPSPSFAFILTSTFNPNLPISRRPTLHLFCHPRVLPSVMGLPPVFGVPLHVLVEVWPPEAFEKAVSNCEYSFVS